MKETTYEGPAPPPETIVSLLAALEVPAALWVDGEVVAAVGPGCAPVAPEALLAFLGPEVQAAAASFLAAPREGELVLGGGARPLVALVWRPLGAGWWLFTADEAKPPDPSAERRRSLIAQLSHEAKTPLVSIRGYLELLRARTPLDERQCVYVERALEDLERQEALLDAWLHAAASAAGKLELRLEAIAMAAAVEPALRAFRARRPARLVEVDIAPELRFQVDVDRIGEVVANLMDNADRYGDPAAPIRVEGRSHAGDARLSVVNQGAGIPAGELTRLFEPFYRARGTRGGGHGLGLAIADAIVRAHGGRLWAESAPTGGTTFTFAVQAESRNV